MRIAFDVDSRSDSRGDVRRYHPDVPSTARTLVSEAWLAARAAAPGAGAVVFDRVGAAALHRVLTHSDATVLAAGWFPRLVADPHASEVTAGVVAYLDCAGNVTAAAERLGVHRNTLQTRLRRAQALGVDLSDPETLLATHLVLTACLRATDLGGR